MTSRQNSVASRLPVATNVSNARPTSAKVATSDSRTSLPPEDEAETPDAHVERSVCEFLRSPPSEPFFSAAGFYKPHLPWHVPERFFAMYDPAQISLPLVKDDDLNDVPPIGRAWALSPPDHELVTAHAQWPYTVQGYLAAISYVDELVGRLIDTLDQTGLAATTTVILWGDKGFHLGEKLHWRKFALWEESTRVPLIVVPPSPPAVRRVYEPVSLIDIFPTIVELAGITPPSPCDAHSLVPLLAAGGLSRPAGPVTTWGRGNHSLRLGNWRYIRYADGGDELYDQAADPYEWTNLAGNPDFDDVRSRLRQMLPRDLSPPPPGAPHP